LRTIVLIRTTGKLEAQEHAAFHWNTSPSGGLIPSEQRTSSYEPSSATVGQSTFHQPIRHFPPESTVQRTAGKGSERAEVERRLGGISDRVAHDGKSGRKREVGAFKLTLLVSTAVSATSVKRFIRRTMNAVQRFIADETAATAIEYCLIAAGIALGIFVSIAGIEARINAEFTAINSSLK
jgi:pilus assembly protein Flp/PilA